MKRLRILLLAGCALFGVRPANAQSELLDLLMNGRGLGNIDAASVAVLADILGVDIGNILGTSEAIGADPWEIGPAMIYADETDRPFREVWAQRQRGWGEVAHSIGMHPGTFNKLRRQGYSVEEIIWMDAYREKYGIREDDYVAWRKRGYSPQRIVEVVAVCDGNRTRVDSQIRGGKWKSVSPVKSFAAKAKGKGPSITKPGSGKAIGKGNAKGKGKAVGKSRTTPSGKAHAYGKGKGDDKGKAKGKGGGNDKAVGKGKAGGKGKGRG